MGETVFRCCKGKPLFFVQYSVAGFHKNYLVCSDCNKLECFSKYIIMRHSVENKIKNFQNEPYELIDDSNESNDEHTEHVVQSERQIERYFGEKKN